MTDLSEDDVRYIKGRISRLFYHDLEETFKMEKDAKEWRIEIAKEIAYFNKVLSGKIKVTHEELCGID